jgi:hypothetical protein
MQAKGIDPLRLAAEAATREAEAARQAASEQAQGEGAAEE